MPGMTMGEREETALPQPEKPGHYIAPAAFPMGGAYVVDLKITAAPGPATTTLSLQTGQNTATAGRRSLLDWLPWIIGFCAVAFVLYRVRRTGQKLDWRAVFNRQVVGGLALLAVMLAASMYVVRNFRRPGSMTPIESQAMEMNMPAPEGALAVELATVERGAVSSTVRYTGQAVGYIEQDVYP